MARKEQSEAPIKRQIINWLRFQKGIIIMPIENRAAYNPRIAAYIKKPSNDHKTYYTGIPDILVFSELHGLIGIEVKTKTGKLSEHQKDFIDTLNMLGKGKQKAYAFVATSLDDVIFEFGKLNAKL